MRGSFFLLLPPLLVGVTLALGAPGSEVLYLRTPYTSPLSGEVGRGAREGFGAAGAGAGIPAESQSLELSSDLPCAEAYAIYCSYFGRTFADEQERQRRQKLFCDTLDAVFAKTREVLAAKRGLERSKGRFFGRGDGTASLGEGEVRLAPEAMPTFGITPMMDRDLASGFQSVSVTRAGATEDSEEDAAEGAAEGAPDAPGALDAGARDTSCTEIYAATSSPIARLTELPVTMDLREEGLCTPVRDQADCGSCWAFGTAAVAEAAILRDQSSYAGTPFEAYFGGTAATLKLSEQYMMNNSQTEINNYCLGGNFAHVLYTLDNGYFDTMELLENFPYTSANGVQPTTVRTVAAKIPPAAYLNPFRILGTVEPCDYSLVSLQKGSGAWSKTDINTIKQHLAQGIAVAASMGTQSAGDAAARQFSSYTGGVVTSPCKNPKLDHQVVVVGYGKYKGTPVWVFRNSWGSGWGVEGYFMVPQGANAMCTEMYAYTGISRYMDTSRASVFRATSWQRKIYEGLIVRGENGLDSDDGTFVPEEESSGKNKLIFIVLGILLALAVIGGIIAAVVMCIRKKQQSQQGAAGFPMQANAVAVPGPNTGAYRSQYSNQQYQVYGPN